MFKDLHEFIAALEQERMLARVGEPVSPDLEIAAVTDRVSKSPGGGPALQIERPTRVDNPVAIKLIGAMSPQ
jgi:4-hydroxy-3-polyprenylbenzoate decarboxylase